MKGRHGWVPLEATEHARFVRCCFCGLVAADHFPPIGLPVSDGGCTGHARFASLRRLLGLTDPDSRAPWVIR